MNYEDEITRKFDEYEREIESLAAQRDSARLAALRADQEAGVAIDQRDEARDQLERVRRAVFGIGDAIASAGLYRDDVDYALNVIKRAYIAAESEL